MRNRPWIGCDLDGTLARFDGWKGINHVGEPIPVMVDIVKQHLAQGYDVKIFTARACHPDLDINVIEDWCLEHIGKILDVTNAKDFDMIYCYDDRAITVEHNTGRILVIE